MRKVGFTIIELIFVIVILGILSVIALPKFTGIVQQAKVGKCKALVGTLNRSVGPTLWSESLMEGRNGSILHPDAAGLASDLSKEIEIPSECGTSATYSQESNITIGTKTYNVMFSDGNASSAPMWKWTQNL